MARSKEQIIDDFVKKLIDKNNICRYTFDDILEYSDGYDYFSKYICDMAAREKLNDDCTNV